MITKKDALRFKSKLDAGEFPCLPDELKLTFLMRSADIKQEIRLADIFHWGNIRKTYAIRLFQMGLFDKDYNLTNYGDGYFHEMSR